MLGTFGTNRKIRKDLLLYLSILFILIFPVLGLSGVMADGEEDATLPEPVTSSDSNPQQSHLIVDSSANLQSPSSTDATIYLYFPLMVRSEATEEENNSGNDNGEQIPDVDFMNEFEQAVLTLTNEERAKAGCGPVAGQYNLRQAAYLHSKDMADNAYFNHTGQNGSRFWERAAAAGYDGFAAGENIAAGYRTAESVMTGWMNSPGHRANILNCSHTHLGVGYYYNSNAPYRAYWTQVFGR